LTLIDILERLESDNSRLFKEAVLREHRDNDLLRRFLIAAFDPWRNWGVTKYDKIDAPSTRSDDALLRDYLALLERLDKRELKGNAARDAIRASVAQADARAAKWMDRLLIRNLRCGVSAVTINKTWPGSIVPFGVALAETLETQGVNGDFIITDGVNYPVRVEAKLDGLRLIAVKQRGEVSLFTRNGTPIETLPRIKAAVDAIPMDDFVLDGEAAGADWNESASVIMSAKSKKDDSTMLYHVFDWVPLSDWQVQKTALTYTERLAALSSIVNAAPAGSPLRLVEAATVKVEAELRTFYAQCLDKGYEGVMLKDLGATYQWKRSPGIQKLKPVATEEGVVVSWYEANRGTKREGQFGGFNVLTKNGVVTKVGGGYKDELKTQIFQEGPDLWIGRVVEVEHQPPFTAEGRLRFPVFSRFRDISDVDPLIIEAYESYKLSR
jgi:DNA ligase-1